MCMYVHVCACMCMYVYVCVILCMYVYVCACMCMYVYVCACHFPSPNVECNALGALHSGADGDGIWDPGS